MRPALDITVDAKDCFEKDNFLSFLQEQREESVEVRALDSKAHDLLQVCDILSGAHNSMMVPQHCGERKLRIARKIWLQSHCRAEEREFKQVQEMRKALTESPAEREVRSQPQYTATR